MQKTAWLQERLPKNDKDIEMFLTEIVNAKAMTPSFKGEDVALNVALSFI